MTQFTGGVSFTAWETFTNCPARFKYEKIDKLPTQDKAFFAKGRAAHEHLEKVVMGAPLDAKIVPKEQEFVLEVGAAPFAKFVEEKWGFRNDWIVTDWRNAALRAIIDVRLDYGDGSMEVIDWKTGKKRGESVAQMSLFATAVFHRYPFVEQVTTRLVYVEKGGQTIMDHARADLANMTKQWEERFASIFNERDWLPRPNEWCHFCDFSKAKGGPCRYGG